MTPFLRLLVYLTADDCGNNVNITLDGNIVLTGTGLTGFTRDNQAGSDTTYCVYSGKFDGGNHSITLATGEPYGKRGNSDITSHSDEGNGKIYRHVYNGLFGIVPSKLACGTLFKYHYWYTF